MGIVRVPRGFSLVEVLVVLGIIMVLGAIILVGMARTRASARSAQCLANLRQIGQAFHSYAVSNSGRLPDPAALESNWESLLRPYLSSIDVLRCPADAEVYPTLGSSYDWRDGGDSDASVAGRSVHGCRADAVLAFDALPGWHRARKMNAVRLDGAALTMDEQACLGDLRRSVVGDSARP